MSDYAIPLGGPPIINPAAASSLKQKLFQALQAEAMKTAEILSPSAQPEEETTAGLQEASLVDEAALLEDASDSAVNPLLEAMESALAAGEVSDEEETVIRQWVEEATLDLPEDNHLMADGESVYGMLAESETETSETFAVAASDSFGEEEDVLDEALMESRNRLMAMLEDVEQDVSAGPDDQHSPHNPDFDDTLSMSEAVSPVAAEPLTEAMDEENVEPEAAFAPSVPPEASDGFHAEVPSAETSRPGNMAQAQKKDVPFESDISGVKKMSDLSGYKDLSKAPLSFGDEDMPASPPDSSYERANAFGVPQHFVPQELPAQDVDTEFSGNVKTLIRLVNELPEGVTKQTGAQIIRLTMEAMGISMEDVLSEAQSAQSEMLDAVRANIKKIEEYKTVIRKLETDIKYYQGKANELSEIIDLFILSNTSGQKMPSPDDAIH